jgi:hypothetical protein
MKYTKRKFKRSDPGRVTWKFVLENNVIYRLRNDDALKIWWDLRDRKAVTVYSRGRTGGWDFVVEHVPSDKCNCGKYYDDTPNGEPFKFQEHPLEYTIVELTKTMRSPILCMMCYYKGEIEHGRWAPKSVRDQLGLET